MALHPRIVHENLYKIQFSFSQEVFNCKCEMHIPNPNPSVKCPKQIFDIFLRIHVTLANRSQIYKILEIRYINITGKDNEYSVLSNCLMFPILPTK